MQCISQGFNSMTHYHDQKQVVKAWVFFTFFLSDSSPLKNLEVGASAQALIEYFSVIVAIVCSACFYVETRSAIIGTAPRERSRHSHINYYLRKYYIGLLAAGSDGRYFSIEVPSS